MTKNLIKTMAMALAAVTFSLPLSTSALAASHNHDAAPTPKHKVEWRHDNHRAVKMSHRPDYRGHQKEEHHSATGNFVTGTIVGAILGAIIAKNT